MMTFASSLVQHRRFTLVGVFGFVVALAAASQIAIPLAGTPVPFTLQPMIVVLAGMMLGPTLGAVSMVLYLALGSAGVPVFTPVGAPGIARLFSPTGGYLIAYPVAAVAAGFVAHRYPMFLGRWVGALLGMVVLFAGGLSQLSILTGSIGGAVALGLTPFALFDVVKAFLAALIARPRVRSPRE